MSKELSKRKKIREAHRTSVRRTMAAATEILNQSNQINDDTTTILMQQNMTLKEKLEILREKNDGILALVRDDEIEEEIKQADILHEEVTRITVQIEAFLKKRQSSESPPQSVPAPMDTSAGSNSLSTSGGEGAAVKAKVRLPKLNLKKFTGNVTEWPAFWDAYKSAIHTNPELNDIDRFNYLNSYLGHSAAEAIAGLKLTSANYSEAISILDKRFGDKQQIINSHMDAMLNLPSVKNLYDIKGLRQFYDKVEANVRGLKSLDIPSTSYGNLMISILMNKLPQDLRLLVTRKMQDDEWNLDTLLTIFQKELQARERACPINSQNQVPPEQKKPQNSGKPSTQSSLLSGNTPTCTYCRQSHPSVSCTIVTSISARKELLRKYGRCYVCLRRNHISRDCTSATRCFKCGKRHHPSICQPEDSKGSQLSVPPANAPVPPEKPNLKPSPEQPPQSTPSTIYIDSSTSVLLQTARAKAWSTDNPTTTMNVRLILDSGSQRSYVTSKFSKSLQLPTIGSESLMIKTFGSTKETQQTCDIVQFSIGTGQDDGVVLKAYSVPTICSPINNQSTKLVQENYQHLHGLNLANCCEDYQEFEVDLLIGSDQYWSIVTGEVVRAVDGPTAIGTKLGFVLSGPVRRGGEASAHLACAHVLKCSALPIKKDPPCLDEDLRRFWELESLGICPNEVSVYDEFSETISFDNGRYEVKLPWKQSRPLLPDNYQPSLQRFKSLFQRLKKDPDVLKEYDEVIKDQIASEIVQQVDREASGEVGRVHYLPHHAVIRRDKETTKLRIVFDASAKSTGPSLNSCLYTGPSLSQNILDILLRFRSYRVALVGDIEKAFLMISISPEDRDALRFFWVDDITKDVPNIIVLRFTRVVFGVSSSPFLLNATISHHIQKYEPIDPSFVRHFMQSMYVDDLSAGEDNEEDAYQFYLKSKSRLAQGGFNLRKFVSNSNELMEKIENNESANKNKHPGGHSTESTNQIIPESDSITIEDASYTKSTVGNTEEIMETEEHKILGVRWNCKDDSLIFNCESVIEAANTSEPTKRNVVSASSRIYDPLGILSPITIRLKMLFQEICKCQVDWDTVLDQELQEKWQKLVNDMRKITSFVLPRCYFTGIEEAVTSQQLVGFCDASGRAYAAVVYLKITTPNGSYARILASKARVSPIDGRQTIPRLELLAAVILARLITNVQAALEPTMTLGDPECWTDSKVTLYWIRNEEQEWKQFVQNRVNEIRTLVPPKFWRHCPGKCNPADMPSRGVSPPQLNDYKPWFNGPEWLIQSNKPEEPTDIPIPDECIGEMKKEGRNEISVLAGIAIEKTIETIIELSRFSDLRKLLRVTAIVVKAVKLLKYRIDKQTEQPSLEVTAEDLQEAELLWLKATQVTLPHNPKFTSWVNQFGLFHDEQGVLRCGGRITYADVSEEMKHPILLNAKHPLSEMIVRNCHQQVHHGGVKETLTEMRARFWLVRGRQFVRKILHRCVRCRKIQGRAYQAPQPPPLPEFRIQRNHPFSFVGVDFAGPLYIKPSENGEGTLKTWVSLYTCCSTRAVHLDLVPNLTSEAFIRNFKRFVARRGTPIKIISDNAKTFLSSSKKLSTLFEIPEVTQHLSCRRVKWSFNLQKAPWWGGFFERLVGSVKRSLKKILGNARLTYEELLTAVLEVEAVLNSRPLTFVSTEDLEEPLTPSHLIYGRRLLSLPNPVTQEIDPDWTLTKQGVTRRMNHLNHLLDQFWKRWKNEYVLDLRESHRQGTKDPKSRRIAIGDMVLVHEDNHRRCHWRMGKVEELIKGNDGEVRGARVTISSKGLKPTTLRRPVQKLYPLEVNCSRGNGESTEGDVGMEDDDSVPVMQNADRPKRPKRAAAIEAETRRKQWIAEGTIN